MQTSTKNHLFNPSDNDFDCPNTKSASRNYIQVVGLTFEHVSNAPQQGAVCSGKEGSEFNNVTVRWTNGAGFLIVGDHHVVTDVGAYDNGMSGIRGGSGKKQGCRFCLIQNSESLRNNRKGYDPFWESGGGKWQYTRHSVFRNLNFSGNYGPGLWLDIKNERNIVVNSRFHGNLGVNLFVESNSGYNLIYNNVMTHAYTAILQPDNQIPNHDYAKWVHVLRLLTDNPEDFFGFGMQIHAASNNHVLYNTMMSNDGGGLRIRYDERDPTVDNLFYNNIMMNFLDHDFYTDSRHRGHEIALQNYPEVDSSALRTNKGEGDNYKSHYIPGQDLTYYASFLYRLFGEDGDVIQLRTNNIIEWREYAQTDYTSFMVDDTQPHLRNTADWEYGWCYAGGTQFMYRAKELPDAVAKLQRRLSEKLDFIEYQHVGSQLVCPEVGTKGQARWGVNNDFKSVEGPLETSLHPNFPNPFSVNTTISYQLRKTMHVRITIYDMLGRNVKTLVDEVRAEGSYRVELSGLQLGSGAYVCRMETADGVFVRKISVVN